MKPHLFLQPSCHSSSLLLSFLLYISPYRFAICTVTGRGLGCDLVTGTFALATLLSQRHPFKTIFKPAIERTEAATERTPLPRKPELL